jgi:hypothetical protein
MGPVVTWGKHGVQVGGEAGGHLLGFGVDGTIVGGARPSQAVRAGFASYYPSWDDTRHDDPLGIIEGTHDRFPGIDLGVGTAHDVDGFHLLADARGGLGVRITDFDTQDPRYPYYYTCKRGSLAIEVELGVRWISGSIGPELVLAARGEYYSCFNAD